MQSFFFFLIPPRQTIFLHSILLNFGFAFSIFRHKLKLFKVIRDDSNFRTLEKLFVAQGRNRSVRTRAKPLWPRPPWAS